MIFSSWAGAIASPALAGLLIHFFGIRSSRACRVLHEPRGRERQGSSWEGGSPMGRRGRCVAGPRRGSWVDEGLSMGHVGVARRQSVGVREKCVESDQGLAWGCRWAMRESASMGHAQRPRARRYMGGSLSSCLGELFWRSSEAERAMRCRAAQGRMELCSLGASVGEPPIYRRTLGLCAWTS